MSVRVVDAMALRAACYDRLYGLVVDGSILRVKWCPADSSGHTDLWDRMAHIVRLWRGALPSIGGE